MLIRRSGLNGTVLYLLLSVSVRQEGILSPILLNVHTDDLLNQLNRLDTDCFVGNSVVIHLMYAEDLVFLCPYSAGLQLPSMPLIMA